MTDAGTTGAEVAGIDGTGPDSTGPDSTGPDSTGPDRAGAPTQGAAAMALPGWRHHYSGKVRDLYLPDVVPAAPDRPAPDVVLVVASDRISAYDHVLSTPIPDKGAILTALSLWWFEQLAEVVPNHLVSPELLVDGGAVAPGPTRLRVPAQVAGRAMLCRRLEMVPVECVARGYLAGSGIAEYRESGSVCGIELPEGLSEGSRLAEPIFTPATKAPLGQHDMNIDFDGVVARLGESTAVRVRELTLAVYRRAEMIARARGLILADTKLEFGRHRSEDGPADDLVLGDEVLTPDSSRFWPGDGWAPGGPQPSFDKQFVRDWLTSPASGWDRHGDQPPPPLPEQIVARTRDRYLEAYERLTGRTWG